MGNSVSFALMIDANRKHKTKQIQNAKNSTLITTEQKYLKLTGCPHEIIQSDSK